MLETNKKFIVTVQNDYEARFGQDMTKKALKEMKQGIERLTNRFHQELLDFQERYIKSYKDWQFTKMNDELIEMKQLNGQTYQGKYGIRTYHFDHKIKMIEEAFERITLYKCKWLKEAEANYIEKFEHFIRTMVNYGFKYDFNSKVEYVNNGNANELGFLVSNNDMEIHARFIYVNGEIKAPHYRFITTVRRKK